MCVGRHLADYRKSAPTLLETSITSPQTMMNAIERPSKWLERKKDKIDLHTLFPTVMRYVLLAIYTNFQTTAIDQGGRNPGTDEPASPADRLLVKISILGENSEQSLGSIYVSDPPLS